MIRESDQARLYMKSARIMVAPLRAGKSPTMQEMENALQSGITAHDYLLGQVWGTPLRTIDSIKRRMGFTPYWVSHEFLYGKQKINPVPHPWERVRDAHTLTYRRDLPLVANSKEMDVGWLLRCIYKWNMIEISPVSELLLRVNYSENLTGRKLARPLNCRGLR